MLYSLNHSITGATALTNTGKTLASSDQLLILLDKSTNDKLYEYYQLVTRNILSKCKVILLMLNTESSIRKQLCMLMAAYHRYDIYSVDDISVITSEYVNNLVSRSPSLDEVQTFIGGDISAYSNISSLVLGISKLVESADMEALKVYIEENSDSIKQFSEVVDYMKRVVDTANSGDYTKSINALKTSLESAKAEIDAAELRCKTAENDKNKLAEDNSTMKKDVAAAKAKITELDQQLASKAPVIKSYSELNTALIKCRVKHIMYFKEISYVAYINSLVSSIYQALTTKELRVKLLIYEQKSSLSAVYAPLQVIGSTEYLNNRDSFISQIGKMVVVEPNQTIIQDILQLDKAPYDVVIVYDRMRQSTDIVTGNNVYKFWVANSMREVKALQSTLKIELPHVITRPEENVDGLSIHIAKIPDYKQCTEYSRLTKYTKLSFGGSDNPKLLLKHITSRCKIEL